jgi:4-diphosphocytidyl-2-C-methyl-D-erythritol kinase
MSILHEKNINSYAKINFRLKVTGRRADGYHTLDMLNSLIDFSDQLKIEINNTGIIRTFFDNEQLNNANNFCSIATNLILDFYSIKNIGVSIYCNKHIPMGGGLGGGSSNASSIIKYLPTMLLDMGLIKEIGNLHRIVKFHEKIGSDLHFFTRGSVGIFNIRGIGEDVSFVTNHSYINFPFYLVMPKYSINTQMVYKKYKELVPNIDSAYKYQDYKFVINSYQSILDLIDNDLLNPASEVQPNLAKDYRLLSQLTNWKVGLSGSGSTMFLMPKNINTTHDISNEVFEIAEKYGFLIKSVSLLAKID